MKNRVPAELKLHARLIALREKRGLTQQTLPRWVELHSQIRRNGSGRKLPVALSLSAGRPRLAQDECGPIDDLRLRSDAASRLVPEEETAIRPATGNLPRNPVAAERRFVENGGANQ